MPVKAVDTTAVGDAFAPHWVWRSGKREEWRTSRIAVTRMGAQVEMPTSVEIEETTRQ